MWCWDRPYSYLSFRHHKLAVFPSPGWTIRMLGSLRKMGEFSSSAWQDPAPHLQEGSGLMYLQGAGKKDGKSSACRLPWLSFSVPITSTGNKHNRHWLRAFESFPCGKPEEKGWTDAKGSTDPSGHWQTNPMGSPCIHTLQSIHPETPQRVMITSSSLTQTIPKIICQVKLYPLA